MKLVLVPDPTSPNGIDAFCREIQKRAAARGHECALHSTHHDPMPPADAVVINSPQAWAVDLGKRPGRSVVLRLIDSYVGAPDTTLAEAQRQATIADRVLVPSAFMKSIAVSWGLGEEKLRVVPYAYDQIFAQQIALVTMRAARPSGFGLIAAGVVDEVSRPGFECVLFAVSRLRLDCHVAVIGDGSALPALKQRAEQLLLGNRVSFLGELAHAKKMEYLRAAKAFVEPSGRQGFPSLALHAMSEGCPVIGAAAGAVPELIEDGVNGLLFHPGDAGNLSEQIVTLASTPGLSLKLIQEGVRTVERHSWDATVSATFDAVESLQART